jgi:hypothetical protein
MLKSWQPIKLDLTREPLSIELTLAVEAVRYVVNDVGRALAGNPTIRQSVPLTWTLELTDSAEIPWRLTTSDVPAKSIASWS